MFENLNVNYKGDMTSRSIYFVADSYTGDFREKMLMNNEILGYLPLFVREDGDEKLYEYDISDKVSLRDYVLEKAVDHILIKKILEEMEKIFLRGKSYVLSEDSFIINPEVMFFNDDHLELCYFPGYEKDIKLQLQDLLSYLMDSVKVTDKTSIFKAYSAYSLAKEDNCTFKTLINCLESKTPVDISSEEPKEELSELVNSGEEPEHVPKDGRLTTVLGIVAALCTFATVIVYFLRG